MRPRSRNISRRITAAERSTSAKRTHLVSTTPWTAVSDDDEAAALVVVRDITDRVQVERELDRERAFLRAVFDNMQDGVSALDSTGSDPVINDALREMLGITAHTSVPQREWLGTLVTISDADGTPITTEQSPLRRALHGEHIPCEPLTIERA